MNVCLVVYVPSWRENLYQVVLSMLVATNNVPRYALPSKRQKEKNENSGSVSINTIDCDLCDCHFFSVVLLCTVFLVMFFCRCCVFIHGLFCANRISTVAEFGGVPALRSQGKTLGLESLQHSVGGTFCFYSPGSLR